MKSKLNIFWTLLLTAGFAACSGSGESEPGNGDGEFTPTAPYTVSVDKSEIEADGEQEAKLILTDANGNVLTDHSSYLNYITFTNTQTGDKLSKTNIFTAIANGTYTFTAKYKSHESENSVTVTAKNRGAYEKYFRRVAAYDITNTESYYCPSMTAALEGVADFWAEHLVILAIHGPYSTVDPYLMTNVANPLMSRFEGTGYPTCIINLDYKMTDADRNSTSIARLVQEQMQKYPATSGIKIASTYANDKITIAASLTSSTGDKYDLGYMLLADNQTFKEREYNDIVVASSNNFMSMLTNSSFTVAEGEEHAVSFEIADIGEAVERYGGKENFRVIVFSLRGIDGTSILDNIAECPLGESQDYVLNN